MTTLLEKKKGQPEELKYNPTLDKMSGDYWSNLYCWPADLVVSPKLGVKVPVYPAKFFTSDGIEKKLSWFVNPKTRNFVPAAERGTWLEKGNGSWLSWGQDIEMT